MNGNLNQDIRESGSGQGRTGRHGIQRTVSNRRRNLDEDSKIS